MKENKIIVQRIPKYYVRSDSAQVMIPFYEDIRIYENDTSLACIRCRYSIKDDFSSINSYLDDKRRHCYPYSNIPLHRGRDGLHKVYKVNQIFNIDTEYWVVVDSDSKYVDSFMDVQYNGYLINMYVLKDSNDCFLVSQYYDLNVYFRYHNCISDFEHKKYTIEEIRGLTPVVIEDINEPKISYALNPNIDRKEIKKAKMKVKELKKSK